MIRDLVTRNRSYRGYDAGRRVSREELAALIDIARLVPSGANLQPLKYRPVYEEAEVERLNGLTRWAKALPDITLPHEGKFPPAYIVICVDAAICKNPDAARTDVGIAAQTILLAAVEKELGGCMLGNYDKEEVREALRLPAGMEPALLLAIGKPDERVVLTEPGQDGSVKYYRSADDTHYVPKRRLEEILL